jgi:hypothetical protein
MQEKLAVSVPLRESATSRFEVIRQLGPPGPGSRVWISVSTAGRILDIRMWKQRREGVRWRATPSGVRVGFDQIGELLDAVVAAAELHTPRRSA